MADTLEVKMTRHISGTLTQNGKNQGTWPDKGETVELDTATAIHMVNAGHCAALDEDAFAAAVEASAPTDEEDSDETTTNEDSNEAGTDGPDAEPAGAAEGDQEAKPAASKAKPKS